MGEVELQDNRPSVYWEDDRLIIRASSIGHPCLFEMVAIGQEYGTTGLPANMYRAFREGHEAEPEIVRQLQDPKYGMVFSSRQVEGELILPNNVVIRYHPDGIVFWEGLGRKYPVRRWVCEIKNLSHDLWMRAVNADDIGATIDEYNWQLSVMMHAERKPAVWVARNKGYPPDPETGIKPYCELEGKLFVQEVMEPIISLEVIAEKAEKIRQGVLGEDILTSDQQCNAPGHWPCRFRHLRPEQEIDMDGVLELEGEEALIMDQKIKRYLYLKGQIDEMQKQAELERDDIVKSVGPEVKTLMTDKFVVPVLQATSSRYRWEDMSPELRAQVEKYKTKKWGKRYIRDIKRRD